MLLDAIDHVVLATADLGAAAAPFERLGFTLTPRSRHSTGNENRALFVGGNGSEFYLELLGVYDRVLASRSAGWAQQKAAMEGGQGLARIVFGAERLEDVQEALRRGGVACAIETVRREDGGIICDVLRVEPATGAGCDLGFLRYPEGAEARVARHGAGGLFNHALPLRRLDHLAVIAPQLEQTTRFWVEVLGVPLHGEVRGRGMAIRQMKVGDAIVELIGPETPESPVAARPAGLISMAAFEVDDVDAAAAVARGRGFNATDTAAGVLPGSRTSTISPDQLSGVALQLIDFGH